MVIFTERQTGQQLLAKSHNKVIQGMPIINYLHIPKPIDWCPKYYPAYIHPWYTAVAVELDVWIQIWSCVFGENISVMRNNDATYLSINRVEPPNCQN